jgi:CrcB protein
VTPLWVALAGAAGALTRFLLDGVVRARRPATFPLATGLINVTGSLLLGVFAGLVLYDGASADWKVIAGTGFCGGYTTFSTASVEAVRLVQDGRTRTAAGYVVGTLALALGAAAVGLAAVRFS